MNTTARTRLRMIAENGTQSLCPCGSRAEWVDSCTGPHCDTCRRREERYRSMHLAQHTEATRTPTTEHGELAATKRMVTAKFTRWRIRRGITQGGFND